MAVGANRNVILSHGGRHGSSAGTYLKNQVVPGGAAAHVPAQLVAEVTGLNPGKHDPKDPSKLKGAVLKQEKSLAPKQDKVKAPTPKKQALIAPKKDPAPEPKKEVASSEDTSLSSGGLFDDLGDGEPVPSKVDMPTSKTKLSRLSKADAYALAVELGLKVPDNPEAIKLTELKSMLSRELGF